MWIWRERSLCYLGCQCWSCFSHPFTFWILCLLRWSRGRFRFHRRKRTWQVITLSHNRLTFLPNDFPRTAGLEPSDRVFGMDFLVGKKNHHFQMTSWHLWGTTTWNKRKGFLVGERFSKKHTHFPQQIGGGSWHVRVSCFEGSFQYWSPFLQDEISMKQYFHDFSCLAWFWALISLMGLRKAIRYVDLSYNQLTTVPTALMQASRPLPEFLGIFGQGQTTFFFFDFSGLACKNIPTMPGYFFGIHSDLSDLKHFFFAQSHSDFSLICDKSCNWPNMYVSPCFLMGVTYQPSTSEPEISEPSRELRELNLSHNRLTTLPEKYEPGTEGVKLQLPVTELSWCWVGW